MSWSFAHCVVIEKLFFSMSTCTVDNPLPMLFFYNPNCTQTCYIAEDELDLQLLLPLLLTCWLGLQVWGHRRGLALLSSFPEGAVGDKFCKANYKALRINLRPYRPLPLILHLEYGILLLERSAPFSVCHITPSVFIIAVFSPWAYWIRREGIRDHSWWKMVLLYTSLCIPFLFCPIISLQQEMFLRAGVGKVGCYRGLWQIGCSKTLTGLGLLSPYPKGGDEGKEPNNKLLSGSACEMQE